MLTLVRWARGRTCIFYVTGQLVAGSAVEELGSELLRSVTA